jgi:2-polyprenyl-6-hydroxyphenyl methylase/3-demethylubiquinone-9 3-methyltransferase
MTSIDASEANIKTAMTHAKAGGLNIDFRAGTAEALLEAGEGPFDVVFNLEVVEHVANPDAFLTNCAKLLKPGGIMFLATLNRTPKAFALAIVGAEYVLGWLPRGTHEFNKFLKPRELEAPLTHAGLTCDPAQGVSFNPLSDQWRLSNDTGVNYMMIARRPA